MKSRPLADLVDLAVQLERDADESPAALHQRDRQLLAGLPPADLPADPRQRLRPWLDHLRTAGPTFPGQRVSRGYRLLLLGLVLLGLIVGSGVASVVFRYDGVRPVNVVHVLAVFVAAQVVLVALVGVVMLPASWLVRIPGAVALQESLASLSPGQAIRILLRRLPGRLQDTLADQGRRASWYHGVLEPVWKWAVLVAAQSFAVAFNVGALGTGLYLVTFSDLAFAWSTTLRPDVERVHRLTALLATPWAPVAPDAVPSLELIRSTLYYRHEPMSAGDHPAGWGGWWPFLVAAMITYGALPRVFLLAWSAMRLRRQLRHALTDSPGAAAVLERLDNAWVSTQATSDEADATRSVEPPTPGGPDGWTGRGPVHLVNWGGLALDDEALRQQFTRHESRPVVAVYHAGGRVSLVDEERAIQTLAQAGADAVVVVLVKAWEPPLLDCLDFLQALRAAGGKQLRLAVLPVATAADGGLEGCAAPALEVWRRKLRSLADPALEIRTWSRLEGATP